MLNTRPSKRPKVADVKTWDVEYENTIYADWRGRTIWIRVENGYPFPDFYRVTYTVDSERKSKLFYGESAWMQVNRLVHDLGFWDWSL